MVSESKLSPRKVMERPVVHDFHRSTVRPDPSICDRNNQDHALSVSAKTVRRTVGVGEPFDVINTVRTAQPLGVGQQFTREVGQFGAIAAAERVTELETLHAELIGAVAEHFMGWVVGGLVMTDPRVGDMR